MSVLSGDLTVFLEPSGPTTIRDQAGDLKEVLLGVISTSTTPINVSLALAGPTTTRGMLPTAGG